MKSLIWFALISFVFMADACTTASRKPDADNSASSQDSSQSSEIPNWIQRSANRK